MAIEVQATAQGYYGRLREVGDRFSIQKQAHMGAWMTPVKELRKGGQADAPTQGGQADAPTQGGGDDTSESLA